MLKFSNSLNRNKFEESKIFTSKFVEIKPKMNVVMLLYNENDFFLS